MKSLQHKLIPLLFLGVIAQLQGQSLDSLKDALKSATSDQYRILLLSEIGEKLLDAHDSAAVHYFEEVILIAKKQNNKLLVATTYNKIGMSWYHAGDLEQSSQSYYKALESTEDTPDFYDIRLRLYNNLGWNYKQFDNAKKAIHLFRQAERYARLTGNQQVLGPLLNNKGVIEKDLGKNDSALLTLKESLLLNRKLGNLRQERFNLNNIGVVLLNLKRYTEAVDTLARVLAMNHEAADTIEIVNNLHNLGTAYYRKKNYEEAKQHLIAALKFPAFLSSDTERKIYFELDNVLVAMGDYEKARFYLIKFLQLTDSLHKLQFHEHTLELDVKYNTLIKDRDLERSHKNLAEQKLYLAVLISAFILILLIAIFLWRIVKMKHGNEKVLIALNKEIEAQAEELRQSNENIQTINKNLETIILERTRVVKEQNQRLIEFSFMNSHKIRGPVATLLGLVNLLADERNTHMQRELILYLKESLQKLDTIVLEVSRQLEDDGLVPYQKDKN